MNSEVDTRAAAAYGHYLAGRPFSVIADRMGTTESHARALVAEERTRLTQYIDSDARENRLYIEAERLDLLQAAYWSGALAGENKDAELVLKIMDRRAKLFGLDKPTDQSDTSRQILIVGGTKEEFMEILREAQTKPSNDADADIVDAEVVEED